MAAFFGHEFMIWTDSKKAIALWKLSTGVLRSNENSIRLITANTNKYSKPTPLGLSVFLSLKTPLPTNNTLTRTSLSKQHPQIPRQ